MGSKCAFFFLSYIYKLSVDILRGVHIVINSNIDIIAFFLPSTYLFHVSVYCMNLGLHTIHNYCNLHTRKEEVFFIKRKITCYRYDSIHALLMWH